MMSNRVKAVWNDFKLGKCGLLAITLLILAHLIQPVRSIYSNHGRKGMLFTLDMDNHINGLDLMPIRRLWQFSQNHIITRNINKLVI